MTDKSSKCNGKQIASKKQASGSEHSCPCDSDTPNPPTQGQPQLARKSIQEVAMISSRSSQPTESSRATSGRQTTGSDNLSPTEAHQSSAISPANLGLDQSAQLRSTLAIGQLIASNRPTAGSRLIANELRQLNKTIKDESMTLRKEIANLSNNLATTLKRVLDDDREQRNLSSTGGLIRRPMFGSFAARRLPVFRRPRRPLQAVQRMNAQNETTSPNDNSPMANNRNVPASKASTSTQTPEVVPVTAQKQTAMKLSSLAASKSPAAVSAAKALAMVFKGPWLTLDRSYDGEDDTDSNETTPSSSP